jgi:hypothetical protein
MTGPPSIAARSSQPSGRPVVCGDTAPTTRETEGANIIRRKLHSDLLAVRDRKFTGPTRILKTRFLSRVRAGYRQLDSESDKRKQCANI